MNKYNSMKVTEIDGTFKYVPCAPSTELPECSLPTTVTDGFSHHFSVGDEIKWCSKLGLIYYGDVTKINKKTIAITVQTRGTSQSLRVNPRELNFD